MRILVVDVDRDLQWHFSTRQKRIEIGSDAQNDLIVDGTASKQIVLEDNRGTITITNNVSGATRLLDVELVAGPARKYIWRPNQELYLSDYVILLLQDEGNNSKEALSGSVSFPIRLQRLIRLATLLFVWERGCSIAILLIALLAMATLVRRTVDFSRTIQVEPTASATLTTTPIAMAIITPFTIPKATSIPTVLITRAVDRPLTPTPANPPTATPLPTVTPPLITASGEHTWQPATLEDDLGLTFRPAIGRKGSSYWRLVSIIWLDEAGAGGRHGIYIDVRDEQHHSIPEARTIVSWDSGSCIRYMPKQSELNNLSAEILDFNNYHINCPMFAAGNIYSARVDGTSDQLVGLGLGTKETRNLPILTSFLLVFERDVLR